MNLGLWSNWIISNLTNAASHSKSKVIKLRIWEQLNNGQLQNSQYSMIAYSPAFWDIQLLES